MNKRYGASLTLVVGLVAGCSGGEPQNLVTGNGTYIPPTPSSQPPVDATIPEAARANTPEGAAAFVTHYIALYNRLMTSSPDPSPLTTLSAPDCRTCTGWIQELTDLTAKDQRATTFPVTSTIRSTGKVSGAEQLTAVVLTVSGNQYDVLDQDGTVDRTIDAVASFQAQAHTEWRDGQWFIVALGKDLSL